MPVTVTLGGLTNLVSYASAESGNLYGTGFTGDDIPDAWFHVSSPECSE